VILKGFFTQGRHTGKSVSDPDVTANYLRMVLWQDLGERVEEIIRKELTRRGEVHFDATYNEAYRREKRAQKARQASRQSADGYSQAGSPRPKSTSAPSLSPGQSALIEVINAGRQALAKRHHPDVGGDEAKMKSVNQAADTLLEMVRGSKL
jgi:hypothetical protein